MQYHLETIPVLDALKAHIFCPFCLLYQQNEQKMLDYTLGGSVMEPDVRIRVNQTGICARHHAKLYAMNNRLSHALLCDSHAKEILNRFDGIQINSEKKGLFSKKASLSEAISKLDSINHGCVVCEDIEASMKRYYYTFIHLWKSNEDFKTLWNESKGICLPHLAELLKAAEKHLNGNKQEAFASEMLETTRNHLMQDEKDLEWFTLKFDYRNQDKPWGNSRDALPRMIARLREENPDLKA